MSNYYIENDKYFENADPHYSTDWLTKTLNREMILGYAGELISRKQNFSLILLDLDNFKNINDNFGHVAGDNVLKNVSKTLMDNIGDKGVVGRYGGDEFMLIVPDIIDYDQVWEINRELSRAASSIVIQNLHGARITITQGVSRYPVDGAAYDELMEKTDKALYRGKQKGRNCFIIYLPEKHANLTIGDSGKLKYSSVDMHFNIFSIMNYSDDFAENIRSVMKFLCDNLMIEHILLQYRDRICHCEIYPICDYRDVKPIPEKILSNWSSTNDMCFIDTIEDVRVLKRDNLAEVMEQQHVGATVFVKIECCGEYYGFLRADATSDKGRIWQMNELDLMLTSAMLIGTLMHERKTDPDELFPA